MSTSMSMLRRLSAEPPPHLKFFMGYAGWAPRQLEAEIVQGAWLHAAATPELVFETDATVLWERAVRSIGIDPAALASASGVN